MLRGSWPLCSLKDKKERAYCLDEQPIQINIFFHSANFVHVQQEGPYGRNITSNKHLSPGSGGGSFCDPTTITTVKVETNQLIHQLKSKL